MVSMGLQADMAKDFMAKGLAMMRYDKKTHMIGFDICLDVRALKSSN